MSINVSYNDDDTVITRNIKQIVIRPKADPAKHKERFEAAEDWPRASFEEHVVKMGILLAAKDFDAETWVSLVEFLFP